MLDVSTEVKNAYLQSNVPVQIKFVIDDITYTARNITAGSVSIVESLCSLETFELSAVEKNELEFSLFNENRTISDLVGKTVLAYHELTLDNEVVDIPLGKYTVVTSEFDTDYVIHCICYDEMLKFDTIIDDWLNTTVQFPITIKDLVLQLFQKVGVTYDIPSTYNNSDFVISARPSFLEGAKASELLGQIQEIVGGFFKADRTGTVKLLTPTIIQGLQPHIGLYPATGLYPRNSGIGYGLDADIANYGCQQVSGDLTIADYTVKNIDKLQIRGTEEDVGIIIGTGENTYVIQGNMLLYGLTDAEGRIVGQKIYDAISTLMYKPFSGTFTALPYVEIGDVAYITSREGLTAKSPILYRVLSDSCLSVDSFVTKGTEKRQAVKEINKRLTVLKQRTHEIVNTVEELSSTITEVATDLDENYLDKTETQSAITQSANSVLSTVSQTYATIERVSGDEVIIDTHTSQISQNATDITTKVSTSDYNGNTIASMINQNATTVAINAEKINLTGYVTATDLRTSGSTVINGANITTGIIQDANRNNYWNLNTGEFKLSPGVKIGTNNDTFSSIISNLQNQIDGVIMTWYYDYVPTINNIPASQWTTETERNNHIGDLFYNKSTGYCYRFMNDNGTYKWVRISDEDISTALELASTAKDTADAKRRVFMSTPTVPYDVGDLWFTGASGDIMTCVTARTSGSYVSSDWQKRNKYTDNTAVTTLDNNLNQQGIFNRLTNNGQTQGIYLSNNKLYINASYIQTGTLSADYINGGTLTMGGYNDQDGVINMQDSNGNVIGIWDSNGISMTGGELKQTVDFGARWMKISSAMIEGGINEWWGSGSGKIDLTNNSTWDGTTRPMLQIRHDGNIHIDAEYNLVLQCSALYVGASKGSDGWYGDYLYEHGLLVAE